MGTFKKAFIESFKDRNGKVDHKRLTAFAFVILFFFHSTILLFRMKEIPNERLAETAMFIEGCVIGAAMGFSMINKPTRPIKNESNEELHTEGDA